MNETKATLDMGRIGIDYHSIRKAPTNSTVIHAPLDTPSENDTDSDTDQYSEMVEERLADVRMESVFFLATFYIIITIIGLLANIAVLYMIARSRRSKAVTSIYIFNLAIADLLYVACLPAAVYPMLQGHWILGHMMCKLYFTCDGVSKFASVMFLVVLSSDRWCAVCQPIASRGVRTAKVAFAASGLSWIFVMLAMIPVFVHATLVTVKTNGQETVQCVILWDEHTFQNDELFYENDTSYSDISNETSINNETGYGMEYGYANDTGAYMNIPDRDWARRIFTLYLFTLSFAIPLCLVWIFYIMILHRLWTQKRNMLTHSTVSSLASKSESNNRYSKSETAMLPANKANQRRRRSTRRVTIMVLSIVIAYTICWIPYWCVQMTIEFFRDDPALDLEIFTIVSYIAYGVQSANSALNPFLYAFGTHSHRRRLLIWLRSFLQCLGCGRKACLTPVPSSSTAENGKRSVATVKKYKSESVDGISMKKTHIRRQILNKMDDDDDSVVPKSHAKSVGQESLSNSSMNSTAAPSPHLRSKNDQGKAKKDTGFCACTKAVDDK